MPKLRINRRAEARPDSWLFCSRPRPQRYPEEVVKQVLIFALAACAARAQTAAIDYSNLRERQVINGFRTAAVYLDDAGRAMGGRFIQIRSGFTLDLLRIQSAPQGFIWVKTYPTSNMGEPHTQEHLLLGKGTRGRALGSIEPMSLVTSSAFTMQWMTCFHFYTAAGPEVFFEHFERMFEALKFPNYTDEEIRREVRNFGVSAGPDGALRLEEQGTVYNEMTTSMDQPAYRLFHRAALAIYGPDHPLAFSAGGLPEALRVIQPADIRRFHDAHYFGGNMGMIAALPKEVTLETALAKIDEALDRVEPRHPVLPVMTEKDLPAPRPAPEGRIEYVPYPSQNAQQPSSVLLVWPAERNLANREYELLNLFLDNFAGDSDTNLYARLVNSRTREADFGIQGINAWADGDQGNPVYVMFRDMPPAGMNDQNLGLLRSKVIEELKRVAAWPDGSTELKAFHQRLKSRILQRRRELARFVNSPPGFGLRGIGSDWVTQLVRLNKEPGFHKSLTEKEDLDAIEAQLAGSRNIWRDALAGWKLTDVTPWIEAAKPDPALIGQEERERAARIAAETERLKRQYGVTDGQAALRRYKAEQDAASRVIEAAAREITPPRFIENPPLDLDDSLQFTTRKLAGGVPLVASTFDSMTGSTVGLALRLNAVSDGELIYLSLLPELLTRSGVIENGKPVPYPEMAERLRSEILGLNANYSINPLTSRYELVIRGSGSNAAETARALEWMKLALLDPDWRPENLSRLRDLVDETLGAVHNRMQGPEETWVEDPARAWQFQYSPLLLATSSFLTREHNLFRLKWMLKGGGAPDIDRFLEALGRIEGTRAERLQTLSTMERGTYPGLESLSASSKKLAQDAARDLEMLLPEIPDSSLPADWTALCNGMRRDLEAGPEKTLAELEKVRRLIADRNGARMFLIGSAEAQNTLARSVEEFPALLENSASRRAVTRSRLPIEQRLHAHDRQGGVPLFVGLLNPNSQGGVFVNSAPGAGYQDTSPDSLLDFLASLLYAGHGAHGIFMKTWSAGLAYSNGIRVRPLEARVNYYAERTPLLPQTLEFVIDELKNAHPDPALVDYAIAGAFDGTRSALSFEERGEAMAEDLADGLTPEVVTRFHRAILDLRKRPDLADELFRRMPKVYERVLPGMGISAKDVPGAVYFVIGPEKQLSAYEQYLKKVEGPGTRLFRLYPRDFWVE
jgi:Zn-dependent M16 (insulinase) family peptidase